MSAAPLLDSSSDNKEPDAPNSMPKVLVGVPIFNSGKEISETLRAIDSLDYPKDLLSIVLIDRSATGSNREFLENWKSNAKEYRSIAIESAGFEVLPKARNRILSHLSDQDYVFFVDADIVLNKGTLKRLIEMARDHSIATIAHVGPPSGHPRVYETDSDSMACTLLDSKLVTRDGLSFDQKLALLPEDLDFCLRSKRKVAVDARETVFHLHYFYFRGRWSRYMRRSEAWMLFTLLRRGKRFSIDWDDRWPSRWLRYLALFLLSVFSLAYLPLSALLLLPLAAYLAYCVWRRGPRKGLLSFINAYVFVPTIVIGSIELLLELHSASYRAKRDERLSRP